MDSYGSVSSEDQNPPRLFINWSIVQQLLQDNTDGAQVQHTLSVTTGRGTGTNGHQWQDDRRQNDECGVVRLMCLLRALAMLCICALCLLPVSVC